MTQSSCFESASLDTNILIHLWRSQTEKMLKQMFDKVYVHQWLIDTELSHHADDILRGKIIDSMVDGFIEPINDAILKKQGLYEAFKQELEDLALFFSGSDTGEGYVIALAKVYGIPAVVTNDIKKDGPKWYLNIRAKEPIGFSSDEVLLIDYLKGALSKEEYLSQFQAMNDINALGWRMKISQRRFVQRFLGELDREIPASVRDHQWINDFAKKNGIDITKKLNSLKAVIPIEESVTSKIPRDRKDFLLSDYPLPGDEGQRDVQECYRLAYRILQKDNEKRDVPIDAVIAQVLEQFRYTEHEIINVIDDLSPLAENHPMYSRLAYMKRIEYDNLEKINDCYLEIQRRMK